MPYSCGGGNSRTFRPRYSRSALAMPLRLVLIEDHQALREGSRAALGREGIEVLGTAARRREGRDLVERLDPDVALIDIRLGEDSGIDLTAELIDADPERRIMLYTGSSEIDLLMSGLDSGARGYALKDRHAERADRGARDRRRGRHLRRPAAALLAALAPGDADAEVPLPARARDHGPARAGADRRAGRRAAVPLARDDQDAHPQRDEQARGQHAGPRDRIALREGFISPPTAGHS